MASRKRGGSPRITLEMAAQIKALCDQGHLQHDVAAHFGINQGRVSEVVNGKRFPKVKPDSKQLPLF